MEIFSTDRLYLRELTPKDAENFYLLNLDPDVIKYTGDQPFDTIESARIFLQNYAHYTKYGFGRWAVIDKTSGVFLGWCGIKYTEKSNEFDIGFRFFKKFWNKGYATEAAKSSLDFAFNNYEMPEIVGRAMVANTNSVKVLEKIGLAFYKTFDFEGQEGVIYKIQRGEKL